MLESFRWNELSRFSPFTVFPQLVDHSACQPLRGNSVGRVQFHMISQQAAPLLDRVKRLIAGLGTLRLTGGGEVLEREYGWCTRVQRYLG